ncbi:hypothetical protein J5N97_013485 [Dioscorea zingiberensis]|uniref:Uncharacterized protein n=1 Tax=Dioscorea zingiberensis TaxID=325984 RepID=A0A9D5CQU4_9LILI|nr:hypothetical protein J5N97_013485 [Dioscorea zingiberensis]
MGEMGGERARYCEQGWHMRGRPGPTCRPPRRHPKQPAPSESWRPSVPLWEKKFCTLVCLISWEKLCETQRVMPMYKRVANWDDAAGEEAFRNAKARYWADINGLHCDIPLPDPDAYIDVIDYDAVIDPLLVEDLYKEAQIQDSEEKDLTGGWDSFLFADQPVPATGWGDEEDQVSSLNNKTEHNPTVPLNEGFHGITSFYSGWEKNNDVNGNFANRSIFFSDTANFYYGDAQHGRMGCRDRAGQNNTMVSTGRDHSSGNGWNNSCGHSENWNNIPPRENDKKRAGGGRFNPRHVNSRYVPCRR